MVEKINKVLGALRRQNNEDIDTVDVDKIAEELEIPAQKVRKIIDLAGQTSALVDFTGDD